ncbi:hypothetical protein MNBD_GAMMA22-1928, partial [hydrothermal vent metagenome]
MTKVTLPILKPIVLAIGASLITLASLNVAVAASHTSGGSAGGLPIGGGSSAGGLPIGGGSSAGGLPIGGGSSAGGLPIGGGS